MAEQILETPGIWNAIALLWRPCNDIHIGGMQIDTLFVLSVIHGSRPGKDDCGFFSTEIFIYI